MLSLLQKLVDIPSISGQEKQVGDFLVTYLESMGFLLKKLAYGFTDIGCFLLRVGFIEINQ